MTGRESLFDARARSLVETYIASRVGQVPEAVAALLQEHDRLRRDNEHAYVAYRELTEGSTPTDAKHECQRCGSDEWKYVDYGGCSECRPHEDRAAEDGADERCDYVPEIRPDGTVIG